MENWDDLRFVLAMHRHGTMSEAARRLGTNVGTVSRRLDRISSDLGLTLFEKRGQIWASTPAALHLAELAETIDQQFRVEILAQAGEGGAPAPIEIAAPPAVHHALLMPRMAEMLARFPNVRPMLTNKIFAQGLGEADIQIRTGRPEGGRLRARRLLNSTLRVYKGRAHRLDGRWIGLSLRHPIADRLRTIYAAADPSPVLRVEEMSMIADLMEETGLPGLLPDFLAEGRAGLVAAELPDNCVPEELWIAYHETRHGDPALRAVVDWIVDFSRAGQAA